jgi:peptidoglycan hydrolase-like protein with peptidoglycan-binding domain
MATLKDDLVIWNALANPELIEVVSEPVFKTITPVYTPDCTTINVQYSTTYSDDAKWVQTQLQANGFYLYDNNGNKLIPDGIPGLYTIAGVKAFQISQDIYVDGIVQNQTCTNLKTPNTLLKINAIYVNPNSTGAPNFTLLKQNGFSDALIMDIGYSVADWHTLKAQCEDVGNTIVSGWVFPGSDMINDIAGSGVGLHLDIENSNVLTATYLGKVTSTPNQVLTYLSDIQQICQFNNVKFSIVTKLDAVDSLSAYGLPSYQEMMQYVDWIGVMAYSGDYGISDANMTAYAKLSEQEAPGKMVFMLESYNSDNDVTPKAETTVLNEINLTLPYCNGVGEFRFGLLNLGLVTA